MARMAKIEVDITQIAEVVNCLDNLVSAVQELTDKYGTENASVAIAAATDDLEAIHARLRPPSDEGEVAL